MILSSSGSKIDGERKMKKIVFWLPCYPDVMYSFIEELARREGNDITVVCLSDLPPERRGIYKQDALAEICDIIVCDEEIASSDAVKKILSENADAIHIFGGFLGRVGEVLTYYHDGGYKRAVVVTEKPSITPTKHFKGVIKLIKKVRSKKIYKNRYERIKDAVAAVFVTGQAGVNQLLSYGIPKEKLFKFMYTHIEENAAPREISDNKTVRFVYVGRFNYLNRGMDALMYAFDKVKYTNWQLDLVGGYGEDSEEIIEWANSRERVSFIGSWQNNEVISRLADYDVCISPTRIDGWRIQVNQAIMAGIGTITTNEAISDELVVASRSGIVVNANKKRELKHAVESVLEHPETVSLWKKNARAYAHKITNPAFVDYFVRCIEYIFNDNKNEEMPECPF